jgi:predicted PurR-regulated permease PerM
MSSLDRQQQSSPQWQPGTRLVVGLMLILGVLILLYLLRELMASVGLALLLAYVLHPLVERMMLQTKLSRVQAVLIVYVVLVIILAGTTTGVGLAVSQRLIMLATYLAELSVELPAQIEGLASRVITIGPWQWDLALINLEPLLAEVASAIGPLLSQTGNMLTSLVRATASTVTTIFLVMIMGYYILVDFEKLEGMFLSWVPTSYRDDVDRLIASTGMIWNAFLRGQFILAIIIGLLVMLVLVGLGVRFAVVLGLIAGLMEFVPMFGPFIAALVAFFVTLFQSANWWGLSPFMLGVVVLGAFVLIQQIENNYLVPRIIGQSLNLHPLVVLISVLAGGSLAGVLGLLLAAPVVATLRLWFGYVYSKVVVIETQPAALLSPNPPVETSWFSFRRLRSRWRSTLARLGGDRKKPEA